MIPEVKPVLALGGDIYPALGGDYPGNFAYSSLQGATQGPHFLLNILNLNRLNQANVGGR